MLNNMYVNNIIYMKNVKIANTYIKKLKGYMFCKYPKEPAILFYPCSSIHTFFMKFSIDIIFLNEDKVVIRIENNIKKNKILYVKKARYVIEAKANEFDDIKVDDQVQIC